MQWTPDSTPLGLGMRAAGNTHNSRVTFAVNLCAATFASAPGATPKLTALKLHSSVFPLLASRLRTAVVPFRRGSIAFKL